MPILLLKCSSKTLNLIVLKELEAFSLLRLQNAITRVESSFFDDFFLQNAGNYLVYMMVLLPQKSNLRLWI